jgi:hypothetical protein
MNWSGRLTGRGIRNYLSWRSCAVQGEIDADAKRRISFIAYGSQCKSSHFGISHILFNCPACPGRSAPHLAADALPASLWLGYVRDDKRYPRSAWNRIDRKMPEDGRKDLPRSHPAGLDLVSRRWSRRQHHSRRVCFAPDPLLARLRHFTTDGPQHLRESIHCFQRL